MEHFRTRQLLRLFFFIMAIQIGGFKVAIGADCSLSNVLCVDDTPGSSQEYSTIQSAVNAAQPGDTVLVFDGNYQGCRISRSGIAANPITLKANGSNAVINRDSSSGDGVYLSDVSNVKIDGFIIQDVNGRCISAHNASPTDPMTNIIIQNITCRRSGLDGFYLSEVSESLIQNNYISATGLRDSPGGMAAHGIYLANAGSKNTTLRNNTIIRDPAYPDYSAGVHINGDKSVGGDGIISGLLIENNRFISCYNNGINMDGVQSSVFRNNLIYGCGRHALRSYRIDGAQGPKNLQIYNNTFIVPADAASWAIKLTDDAGGHTIFNNILLNLGSSGGSLCVSNNSFFSNNNLTINRMSRDGENSVITLSTWKSQTGQDANSATTSPTMLFISSASADYHLKSGSPAINAGREYLNTIAAASLDLDGTTRPQGDSWDIGAYEYIEAGGNTTPPHAPTGLRVVN
jgi:hypothetical protein